LASGFSVSNIHLFVGATLCATSVGITARVFKDLGKLQLTETKIILGAAVIDDVLGIVILSIVAAIVTAAESGTGISFFALSKTALLALGFLVGAIGIGMVVVRRLMPIIASFKSQGVMVVSAVMFCFLFAWLADLAGLAAIIGAFAAGLILEEVHFKQFKEYVSLHDLVRPVNSLLVPLFFILMGIQVRLESFGNTAVLGFALVLTFVAILGKQACGWGVMEKGLNRLVIGLGMIPRGEVGLIFAGIGRQLHVIDDSIFSAIVIMVIITTFVTPFALKVALAKTKR
jgi:Kef-type K+ transport system membrane component KefB